VIGSLAFYLFYANQNSKREYADKIEKLEKLIAIFNPDYQKNREEKRRQITSQFNTVHHEKILHFADANLHIDHSAVRTAQCPA
jgi:hypothetical protein